MYSFSKRSLNNLDTADTRLQLLCNEVIKHIDFSIIEGYRSRDRQKALYDDDKSQIDGITMLSKHNHMPSRAVDVIPYEKGVNPFDRSIKSELLFYRLFRQFYIASEKLNIPINWGGFWSFKDYPHIELKE